MKRPSVIVPLGASHFFPLGSVKVKLAVETIRERGPVT